MNVLREKAHGWLRGITLLAVMAVGTCAHVEDCYGAESWTLTSVGPWKGVGSMTVSQDENYIVFSQLQADGRELAFEARKANGAWQEATPIESLNTLGNVGGIFMTDDCRHLYFHAKTDEANGYDIYTADLRDGKWGKPRKVADLCSATDDMYPSLIEGGLEIYFLRHQVTSDAKAERKEGDKMSIYHSRLNKEGKWTRVQPINPAISFGFVQDARIMRDGETLLYSTRPEKRDKARPVFTRRTIADQWLLPEYMNDDDGKDFLCLQNAGSSLYLIMPDSRKNNYGTIFRTSMPDTRFASKTMATEHGDVINKLNQAPVSATIEVRDPTTNDLIGEYRSSEENGVYHVINQPGKSYLVETRADGYSFYSELLEYDASGETRMPKTIELFDTASVGITLFDNDIFQPIDGKVIAVRQSDKAIFRATKGRTGWSQLKLPLGSDYNIIATAKGFGENSFLFKVAGDIVFDHYEREIPMSPVRREVAFKVYDDETFEVISTEILFKSLDRNENLTLAADKSSISLREGDKYNITLHPKGYMFSNFTINLLKDTRTQVEIPLTALRAGAKLLLHDILFDVNQAFLRPESYAELDRVVRLMNENPELKIEIQAHTDNTASAGYNKKLSDRRADSALQYLVENGIDKSRMRSVGYGATKPVADNSTEEGRQLNRRVELLIIE